MAPSARGISYAFWPKVTVPPLGGGDDFKGVDFRGGGIAGGGGGVLKLSSDFLQSGTSLLPLPEHSFSSLDPKGRCRPLLVLVGNQHPIAHPILGFSTATHPTGHAVATRLSDSIPEIEASAQLYATLFISS